MNAPQRALTGCVVGVSISESDESPKRGFPSWQVNRITLQVSAALFGQGAGVVFGHDWRDDGVMEAVQGFARQMQPSVPLSAEQVDALSQPLLRNILPWPDEPRLCATDLECLGSTLRVESAGLPPELQSLAEPEKSPAGRTTPLYRYLRARGLTHLRWRLNEVCCARLCFGGKIAGSSGRFPGVVEEALLAVQSGKPLFLAGLLGGAAQQLIAALEGQAMPEDFCASNAATSLYARPPIPENDPTTRSDRVADRKAVWDEFRSFGLAGLARSNRLTESENREFFHSPSIERIISLTLAGLSRLRM